MSPTPPAWSRWIWVTTTVARSPGPTPSAASASRTTGADGAVPVSTRHGRSPRIRYPAVIWLYPAIRVSISNTSCPSGVTPASLFRRKSAWFMGSSRVYHWHGFRRRQWVKHLWHIPCGQLIVRVRSARSSRRGPACAVAAPATPVHGVRAGKARKGVERNARDSIRCRARHGPPAPVRHAGDGAPDVGSARRDHRGHAARHRAAPV